MGDERDVLLRGKFDPSGIKAGAREAREALATDLGAGLATAKTGVDGVDGAVTDLTERFAALRERVTKIGETSADAAAKGTESFGKMGASFGAGLIGPMAVVSAAISGISAAAELMAEDFEVDVPGALLASEEKAESLRAKLADLRIELDLLRSGKDADPIDIDISKAEAGLERLRDRFQDLQNRRDELIGWRGAKPALHDIASGAFDALDWWTGGELGASGANVRSAEEVVRDEIHRQVEFLRNLRAIKETEADLEKDRDDAGDAEKERTRVLKEGTKAREERTKAIARERDELEKLRDRAFGESLKLSELRGELDAPAAVIEQRRKVEALNRELAQRREFGPQVRTVEQQAELENLERRARLESDVLFFLEEQAKQRAENKRLADEERDAARDKAKAERDAATELSRQKREEERFMDSERKRVAKEIEDREKQALADERSAFKWRVDKENDRRAALYKEQTKVFEEQEDRFKAAEQIGEGAASAIAAGVTRGIASGDFDGFFAMLQNESTEAFAAALVNALLQKPLEDFLGGQTGGIFGLFNSRGEKPNAPVDAEADLALSAGEAKQALNIVADFSGQPDEVAKNLSANGARTIVVKAGEGSGTGPRRANP